MKEKCFQCERVFEADETTCPRCGLSRKYANEVPETLEDIHSGKKVHDGSVAPRQDEKHA